jgi:hypothetical protein
MSVSENISQITQGSLTSVAVQETEQKNDLEMQSQLSKFFKPKRTSSAQSNKKRSWDRLRQENNPHSKSNSPENKAMRLALRCNIVTADEKEKGMLTHQMPPHDIHDSTLPFPLHRSLSGKDEVIDTTPSQKREISKGELIALSAHHHLSKEQFQEILDYVQRFENEWERSAHDILYFHRLHSGLPRVIFWIRGKGVYIKLTGQYNANKIDEACHLAGLNRDQYRQIKILMNQHLYNIDRKLPRMHVLSKNKSGLPTNVLFHPQKGLFIHSLKETVQDGTSSQAQWIKADFVGCWDPETIATGTFKHVVKGMHLQSGKVITIGSSGRFDGNTNSLVRGNQGITDSETYAIKTLNHSNIQSGTVIGYPGTKIDPLTNRPIVKRALLSPLYGMGDLLSCLRSLNHVEKTQIAIDLMEALVYLHGADNKKDQSGPWVHFDIKPENILVERRGGRVHAVLGDLGFAGPELAKKNSFEGTIPYLSPEMCSRALYGPVGTYSDVWSAGVTLYALFFGNIPAWSDVYSVDALLQNFYNPQQFEMKLESELSSSPFGKLLTGMLRIHSDQRLSSTQCLNFLKQYQGRI